VVCPIAIPGETHDLPGGPVDRQRDTTGEAALGVETDGMRLLVGRFVDRAEELLRRRGEIGIGSCRRADKAGQGQ